MLQPLQLFCTLILTKFYFEYRLRSGMYINKMVYHQPL